MTLISFSSHTSESCWNDEHQVRVEFEMVNNNAANFESVQRFRDCQWNPSPDVSEVSEQCGAERLTELCHTASSIFTASR